MTLAIRDFGLSYGLRDGGSVTALRGIDLTVEAGEIVGIVGESGCGKSTLAYAILRALPSNATPSGTIRYHGTDLIALDEQAMQEIRWARISMVFQASLNAFSPVHRIVDQLAAVYITHTHAKASVARDAAGEAMSQVGIPPSRLRAYPHEFSGGMRQRAAIALALLLDPDVLIADEPTTALDVVVQEHVLQLIADWQRAKPERRVVFVSHDIGVITQLSDRVAVMYAGQIVETCDTRHLLSSPQHPYTRALLECMPRLHERGTRLKSLPGSPPDLHVIAPGCQFRPRCIEAFDECERTAPDLWPTPDGGASRCLKAISRAEL